MWRNIYLAPATTIAGIVLSVLTYFVLLGTGWPTTVWEWAVAIFSAFLALAGGFVRPANDDDAGRGVFAGLVLR